MKDFFLVIRCWSPQDDEESQVFFLLVNVGCGLNLVCLRLKVIFYYVFFFSGPLRDFFKFFLDPLSKS